LRHHIGTKSRVAAIATNKGDPFTDGQILALLEALPQHETGRRWADAIQLMAELGLRPIELLHLSERTDANSRESYWWCTYRKRNGGGVTEPCRLFPLPLVDLDGDVQQWNLLARWQARLIGTARAFRKRFEVPDTAVTIADRICQKSHHDWIEAFLVSHREVRSAEQHQRPGDR